MKKFNAKLALGSLTSAVALMAGLSAANAQTAPGGGSFPGSFLIPGTNTSLAVGGAAHLTIEEDLGPKTTQVFEGAAIPLGGPGISKTNTGGFELHAKQSNFFFETRTPTGYGDLTTFVLFDAFPTVVSPDRQAGITNDTTRLVLAYGTLGPWLAGQALSLFFDGDALPETVDPTVTVGTNNGNFDRSPQIRYTYAAPGGVSLAVSVENPETAGVDNAIGNFNNTALNAQGTGGSDIVPDVIVRGRIDQAWGHLSAAGLYRNLDVISQGTPHLNANGYAGQLSGHLNTFGKDTLRAEIIGGNGIGNYLSDNSAFSGVQTNFGTGLIRTQLAWGGNVGYTHYWTGNLRSTLDAGYSHFSFDSGIDPAQAGNTEKQHWEGAGNLIWSPVPQVDVGLEYIYARRIVWSGASGYESRIEGEWIFKF